MAASYSSYQLSVIQSLFVISLVSIYLKAPVYLLQHLGGTQVPFQTVQSGRTEPAAHAAAHLG